MTATPSESRLKVTRRQLPHWALVGSVYFVTFRLQRGRLDAAERALVLEHLRSGDPVFYRLFIAVVMPDHVHALLQPEDQVGLSRIMKGIKGVSARKLNQRRGTHGSIWQDESHDRIIRDERELRQKAEYILSNPIRAGLVEDAWSYDHWYLNNELFA